MRTIVLLLIVAGVVACNSPQVIYVSPEGEDNNPGTSGKPLKTIQLAVDMLEPGGECILKEGYYRQSFEMKKGGIPGNPVTIRAENEYVVVTRTQPVTGKWELFKENIYRIKLTEPTGQLFVNEKMMTPARWPNMKFPEELWSCSKWATAGIGSRHMKMIDPELPESGVDWTGATAVLNVAHQFFSWTRKIENYEKGGDTFTYKSVSDLIGRKGEYWKVGTWEDDRYYLIGKLEALDAPEEWFYDKKEKYLYLHTPGGDDPQNYTIDTRVENYAFHSRNVTDVTIRGITFYGAAFKIEDCDRWLLENCAFRSPSYGVRPPEHDPASHEDEINPDHANYCYGGYISGEDNIIRKCAFTYGSLAGVFIYGNGNIVENSIFHDFSWDVSLIYKPIYIQNRSGDPHSKGNIVKHNTIYNAGGPCLQFKGYNSLIEYNHIFNGLKARCGGSKDGSVIYTGGQTTRGSQIRYNWVHDAIPELNLTDWGGGIGIRGDGWTRGMDVHHNVVWNIGGAGILVKGDSNRVYNNTVINIGSELTPMGNYIQLRVFAETNRDPNSTRVCLPETNVHSLVFNNAALTITGDWDLTPYHTDHRNFNNYQEEDLHLEGIIKRRFTPLEDSPLLDAGEVVEGLTGEFTGDAPDIGAYEKGSEYWIPGADWTDDN